MTLKFLAGALHLLYFGLLNCSCSQQALVTASPEHQSLSHEELRQLKFMKLPSFADVESAYFNKQTKEIWAPEKGDIFPFRASPQYWQLCKVECYGLRFGVTDCTMEKTKQIRATYFLRIRCRDKNGKIFTFERHEYIIREV